MEYELSCKYNTRNSFYGKAIVKKTKNKNIEDLQLFSYGTLVARITKVLPFINYFIFDYNVNGKTKTQTTTRHQKEFFKQNGLSDKEIKELFKNGVLEKEV